jgi:hypothetical protein
MTGSLPAPLFKTDSATITFARRLRGMLLLQLLTTAVGTNRLYAAQHDCWTKSGNSGHLIWPT